MKKMYILLVALITLILLGCSTPSTLKYDNSNLSLHVNNRYLPLQGSVVKTDTDHFGILYLEQKLIKLADGSLVMYEYGQTEIAYEFATTTTQTIEVVFDAIESVKVYEESLFFAYQLHLAKGRVLNLIAIQTESQELTMLYGMSSKQLDKMLQKLNPNTKPVPYRNVINLANEKNPLLSRWTTTKINFIPLVDILPPIERL